MDCILKRCANPNCKTLGECGAAYALERAGWECGYEVFASDNPIREALLRAGLVVESNFSGSTVVLRAVK